MSAAVGVPFLTASYPTTVSWAYLNQDFEFTTAQMFHSANAVAFAAMRDHLGFRSKGWEGGIWPVYAAVCFKVLGRLRRSAETVDRLVRVRLVTRRNEDGSLERTYLHFRCEFASREGEAPLGASDFWVAPTRQFAPDGDRRIRSLPEAFSCLQEHALEATDTVARPMDEWPRGTLGTQPGSGDYEDVVLCHRDRTDPMRHLNGAAHLQIAADLVARGFHANGGDAGALRIVETATRFRKPFLLGQLGRAHVRVAATSREFSAQVRLHRDDDGRRSARASIVHSIDGVLD